MIGWLQGRVLRTHATGSTLIDVNGVGYEVNLATADEVRRGDVVELYIHTQVRADAIVLYGFVSAQDKEFFTTLLVTPGVGPSTALAALRTMATDDLRSAIENGDVKRVAQIPGVGTKTASRIVLELKGKLVDVPVASSSSPSPRPSDIEEALRSLGYTPSEIRDTLEGVVLPVDESSALRTALQLLGRR
ncbi:MAG: Holliday junction branch migration protein RuvA [Actinomycetota bacterium]|nr:Holliday junction branch migration protein RuvA [Actinomycetota bacterium]